MNQNPTNAIRLIRDHHKILTGLFRQWEGIQSRPSELKRSVTLELFMELEIHSQIELKIFYPAFHEAAQTSDEPRAKGLANSFIEAHHSIDEQIIALRKQGFRSETFDENLSDLIYDTDVHLREEENLMFPLAEKLLKNSLEELGIQMENLSNRLMNQRKYKNARPEVAQNPNGGEQMRPIDGTRRTRRIA